MTCAVFGCKNRKRKKDSDVKYYSFPKNEEYAQKWVDACHHWKEINVKNARICSIHFSPDSYAWDLKYTLLNYHPKRHRNLKPDAVPTEFLPFNQIKTELSDRTKRFNQQLEIEARKEMIDELLKESENTKINYIIGEEDELGINNEIEITNGINDKPGNIEAFDKTYQQTTTVFYIESPSLDLTKASEYIETLEAKNSLLENEIKRLKTQNEILEGEKLSLNTDLSKLSEILNSRYTTGQVTRLLLLKPTNMVKVTPPVTANKRHQAPKRNVGVWIDKHLVKKTRTSSGCKRDAFKTLTYDVKHNYSMPAGKISAKERRKHAKHTKSD